MKFYLGVHKPCHTKVIHPVPFMMSVRRIQTRKKHIWGDDWLLDSGGFSELQINGCYTISEEEYVEVIMRHRPKLAFCQDWMCEDIMLEKTGLTILDHQQRTLDSYLSLSEYTPRIAPVLQGMELEEYLHHASMHESWGVDMSQVFGLGSVCRRSTTIAPVDIVVGIKEHYPMMKIHAFGVKTDAFKHMRLLDNLYSADSMAWCMWGWRNPQSCDDCPYERRQCRNCIQCGLMWHANVIRTIENTRRLNEAY